MKRIKVMLSTGVVLIVLVAFTVLRIGSVRAAAPNSATWHQVASPNEGSEGGGSLRSVAAISNKDIWSVGQYYTVINNESVPQTLAEHWNGTKWSVVSTPDPSSTESWLNGVAAASSDDVWAVGWYQDSSGAFYTLIEHWDGTQWSVIPSPNVGGSGLLGVTAISSDDVWAVGDDDAGSLVEHWNGSQWSIVPSANPSNASGVELQGITAFANNDIWAVGNYINDSTYQTVTLTEHWDGSAWSIVSSPNGGVAGSTNLLTGVAGVSTNDLWAVGYNQHHTPQHKYIEQTLTEHWNGTQWSVVSSPDPSPLNSTVYGVAALASNNVWAVGSYKDKATGEFPELILHWNGTKWLKVAPPAFETGITGCTVYALTLVPHTSALWSVGQAAQNNNAVTFITTNK